MAASMVRVRLSFENYSVLSGEPSPVSWLLVEIENTATIRELENKIKDRFQIPSHLEIGLTLDGFQLPSLEKTLILRDNDSIRATIYGDGIGSTLADQRTGCDLKSWSPQTPDPRVKKRRKYSKKEKKKKQREQIENDTEECPSTKGKRKRQKSHSKGSKKRKCSESPDKVVRKSKSKGGKKKSNAYSSRDQKVKSTKTSDLDSDEEKDGPKHVSVAKLKKGCKARAATAVSDPESSSDNGSESDSMEPVMKSNETAKPAVDQCNVGKANVNASSSSCSSSDSEDEEVKNPVARNMTNTQSEDSEVERKASANAEAEKRLEELLKGIDEKTKARRRRRKRENQRKRKRKRQEDQNGVPDSNDFTLSELSQQESTPQNCRQYISEFHTSAVNGFVSQRSDGFVPSENGAQNSVDNVRMRQEDIDHVSKKMFDGEKNSKNFPILSKEKQLSANYTNCSFIYENLPEEAEVDELPVEECEIEHVEVKDYTKFPVQTSFPEPGFRMAYKVLELSDCYSPEVSDYKECEVMVADAVTKTLVVKLIVKSKGKKVGKFDVVDDDYDTTGMDSVDVVSLSWTSLIEPRLIA